MPWGRDLEEALQSHKVVIAVLCLAAGLADPGMMNQDFIICRAESQSPPFLSRKDTFKVFPCQEEQLNLSCCTNEMSSKTGRSCCCLPICFPLQRNWEESKFGGKPVFFPSSHPLQPPCVITLQIAFSRNSSSNHFQPPGPIYSLISGRTWLPWGASCSWIQVLSPLQTDTEQKCTIPTKFASKVTPAVLCVIFQRHAVPVEASFFSLK